MTARRRGWMLAAALLLLGVAAEAGQQRQPPPDPGGHLQQAWEAFGGHKYTEALEAARRAVAAAPSSSDAFVARGSIAEFLGEFDEAREAYAKAEALAPDDPDVVYHMAALAARLGEFERALELLDRIVPPQDPWWIQLVNMYAPSLLPGRPPQREARDERSLQLKVDIVMEKGDLEGAYLLGRKYRIILAGRDYCTEAVERWKNRTGESFLILFRRATLAQPNGWKCVWWYGQRLTDDGFVRLGKVMVRAVMQIHWYNPDKTLMQTYLKARLSNGREISKRVEQLAMMGRQSCVRDGDVPRALRLLEQAIRLDPAFPRSYHHVARIAWDRGDREAAIGWLRKALQADPDSYATHRYLADALETVGRPGEAEAHLRSAMGLFSGDVGARLALARLLYAQQQFQEYAGVTRAALQAGQARGHPLPEIQAFLAAFEKAGPGRTHPPAPDPPIFIARHLDWEPQAR